MKYSEGGSLEGGSPFRQDVELDAPDQFSQQQKNHSYQQDSQQVEPDACANHFADGDVAGAEDDGLGGGSDGHHEGAGG